MANRNILVDSIPKIQNIFFIYEVVDASDYKIYLLYLYLVCSNGQKITINIVIENIFFDIKLKDKNLIDSYIDEFNSESYDVIIKQSFDSTEKYDFIRLYFKTYKEQKEALNYLKKIDNLTVLKSNAYLTKKKDNIIREIEEY
ncbi:hypothetical protein F8M41_014859 [Gigaspora margarita]|uniref:Uncharacterized protein n=1 Tax=Gigaspora margarita TaxID=4874 RepID=A0A8H4AR44_GIGMA|nr:hypothetical protein F8M41_014859 [Gigaspora margarita]